MTAFGSIADYPETPEQWDLRACGWAQCHSTDPAHAEYRHVLLADVRNFDLTARVTSATGDTPGRRMIMISVEHGAERALFLTQGCAETLSTRIGLCELDAGARRVPTSSTCTPAGAGSAP